VTSHNLKAVAGKAEHCNYGQHGRERQTIVRDQHGENGAQESAEEIGCGMDEGQEQELTVLPKHGRGE
jgi:hypothetical protein